MSNRLAPLSVIVVKGGLRFTGHHRYWVPEVAAAVADQLAAAGWPEVLVRDDRNHRVLHVARHEWPAELPDDPTSPVRQLRRRGRRARRARRDAACRMALAAA